ncbi:MAG TPA: hypothetical protein VGS03_01925 [Candidatus Polarisedimenticolia bacterium]|nr:hypothetical protein [Candidatus Polarisedimenticolia bacterium]
MNGWISVPRSVLTADWYADPFARALWLHLMLSANFAPSVTRAGLSLGPGQLVTSWPALALAMKAHPSKVRRTAALLGKAGEATFKPTGRPTYTGTVVTLERWALYASDTEQPTDHPTAEATDRLSEGRHHSKNTTGLSALSTANDDSKSNGNVPAEVVALRRRREAFARECAESAAEVARVRARERGGVVA